MNKLMNRAGLLAAAFALALAVPLALNAAAQTTEVAEAQTPVGTDTDNDGLIEIKNYDQLYAMRWDEKGKGSPDEDVSAANKTQYSIHLACGRSAPLVCNGYELGGNISLAGRGDWVPSGLNTVFNGNGFSITELEGKHGLFSGIGPSGVLKNLNVVSASITKGKDDGVTVGVISASNNGTIIGVYASGDVTLEDPTANGSIMGSIGGLVGRNSGTIAASVADVDVTVKSIPIGKSVRVGGFAGINYGKIHGSYAYGDAIDGRSVAIPAGAPGFRARGFAFNHGGKGGEIHWSFSYGNKKVDRSPEENESPARFPTSEITNSCALDDRRSKFTFADCPTPTPTPTN